MKFESSSIESYSGRVIDLAHITPETITIEDIAHSLSMQCRYTGHCNFFYSVAEHCVLGTELVPKELALAFLLHDASEAYYADISRPLKSLLPEYKILEHRCEEILEQRYLGKVLSEEKRSIVKRADLAMLMVEAEDLLPSKGIGWDAFENCDMECPDLRVKGWPPFKARAMFLHAYDVLKRVKV